MTEEPRYPDGSSASARSPGRRAARTDGDGEAAPSCDQRVLAAIRQIIQSVDIHSRKLATTYRVTGPQLVCLLEVADRGAVTATQIANAVHLSASTVVGIIDRLEAKELVSRERDRTDRRLVHVSLTAAGRKLIDRAPSPLQDSLREALGELPRQEQARLADSLERLARLTRSSSGQSPA